MGIYMDTFSRIPKDMQPVSIAFADAVMGAVKLSDSKSYDYLDRPKSGKLDPMRFITEESIKGAYAWPQEDGSLYPCVMLTGMPLGMPDTFGSESKEPILTMEDAALEVKRIMRGLLAVAARNAREASDYDTSTQSCWVHGVELKIATEMINHHKALLAECEEVLPPEVLMRSVGLTLENISKKDRFSEKIWHKADQRQRDMLLYYLCLMMAHGEDRYPAQQTPDTSPS